MKWGVYSFLPYQSPISYGFVTRFVLVFVVEAEEPLRTQGFFPVSPHYRLLEKLSTCTQSPDSET